MSFTFSLCLVSIAFRRLVSKPVKSVRSNIVVQGNVPFKSDVIAMEVLDPLKVFTRLVLGLNPASAFCPTGLALNTALSVPDVQSRQVGCDIPLSMCSSKGADSTSVQRKHLNEFWTGQTVQGKVRRMAPYGAFVDIGAVKDCLLHNSQVSQQLASKLRRKLKEGDTVECRIQEVHLGKDQISLTTRWLLEEFEVGQYVEGKVTRIKEFGAFVDIGATKDALIHISQLAAHHIENVSEQVQPGDILKCRIIENEPWKDQIAVAYQVAPLGDPLVFEPSPNAGGVKAAVLWLHGFGDGPESWAGQLKPLRDLEPFSSWKWIHLRAPQMKQPAFGYQRSSAWGQFFDSEILRVGSCDYDEKDKAGWYRSCVEAIVQQVLALEKEGVPLENIIIGGFSQGAAVALETVLTMRRPVAGCIALSGWLTRRTRDALFRKLSPKTPILLCHGNNDNIIDFGCAVAAEKHIKSAGIDIQFVQQEGLQHDCNREELAEAAKFIHRQLCPEAPEPDVNWEQEAKEEEEQSAVDQEETRAHQEPWYDDNVKNKEVWVSKKTLQTMRSIFTSGRRVNLTYSAPSITPETLPDGEVLLGELLVPLGLQLIGKVMAYVEEEPNSNASQIFAVCADAALENPKSHESLAALKDMQAEGAEIRIGIVHGALPLSESDIM